MPPTSGSTLALGGYPSERPKGSKSDDASEGWTAENIFTKSSGFSLKDVVFLPGTLHNKAPELTSRFTKNLKLNTPAISGGKCTEEGMAMALALSGGLGIIHREMSIKDQAMKVQRVKMYNCGFILNPACLAPRHTVEMAQKLQNQLGCSGIPITENGRVGGRLLALVTKRDLEEMPSTAQLSSVMNRDVVFAQEPVTLKEAHATMQQAKVAKLPVLNKDQELVALICRRDMKQVSKHPLASRDANRQLMVAASVTANDADAWDRVKAMVESGADVLSLEIDDGVDHYVTSFLKQIKEEFAGVDVIAGPVNSIRQASLLCENGADAIRVGRAHGAEATVIYEISRYLRQNFGVPVIADVEVNDSGQMLKALLLGASTVCLDSMVQRCEEVPGDLIFREGVRVKLAQPGFGADGTTGRISAAAVEMGVANTPCIDRGSALGYVPVLLQQLCRGLQDVGLESLSDTSKALDQGLLRLELQCCRPNVEIPQAPKMFPIVVNALHC